MHKHHAEAMELTTKRTVFQGREHSDNLLVMTTARSATWCLSGPDLVPPEASHTYAQCFITDSCVTALEVFLAAQNNFWCRRQCCAPRRSRNCSAACSGMNSLESFERECQWIWTYSQVRCIHPLLILLGKSEMTILTVRYFCIITINLVYIDNVLCHDLSLTSVESRSHLVSLLCPRWSHSKNYLIKHYQSLLMAFVLNKKNLKIKLHLDALFEIFSSVIFVVSLQNAGRKLC